MSAPVTVGLDDSPESRAAVEWAAREALLRGLPLKIVHVEEPAPVRLAQSPLWDPGAYRDRAERMVRESVEGVRLRHPGVEVTGERRSGTAADLLGEAAGRAGLLVLGSRGHSALSGFLVGSVSLAVVARAERPVVLVRAGEQAADEHMMDPAGVPSAAAPFRPVVLGLDVDAPDDTLLEFAFAAAALREAPCGPSTPGGWHRPPSTASTVTTTSTTPSHADRPTTSPRCCAPGGGSSRTST